MNRECLLKIIDVFAHLHHTRQREPYVERQRGRCKDQLGSRLLCFSRRALTRTSVLRELNRQDFSGNPPIAEMDPRHSLLALTSKQKGVGFHQN